MSIFLFTSKAFVRVLLSLALFWLPSMSAQAVNINTASSVELQSIKGIGEKTAQRIIDERARAGDFESAEDLSIRIKGLGKKRADKMVEEGLVFSHKQTQHTAKPSVVSQEVAAVKKHFKDSSSSSDSGPYLLKIK